MTEFNQPPRREMPPEVRDRLRRRLWRDLDVPARPQYSRAKMAIAAAVSVTVIAGFAVIFGRAVPTPVNEPADQAWAPPQQVVTRVLDDQESSAEMDRCYQALATTGRTSPARTQWTSQFANTGAGGISVTAVRAADETLFCESTLTSVTVSDPDAEPIYATDSGTGVLFATPNGTIAGVVDPTWRGLEVEAADGTTSTAVESTPVMGLFVTNVAMSAGPDLKLSVRELPVDEPAEPLDDDDPRFPYREIASFPPYSVSLVDRPVSPPADRTSPRGQALGKCLEAAQDPVPDQDSWQPGASAAINGEEFIMASNSKAASLCQWQPSGRTDSVSTPPDMQFRHYLLAQPVQYVDALLLPAGAETDSGLLIAGTVRPNATAMSVVLDGSVELNTDVRAGTFLSVLPPSLLDETGSIDKQRLDGLTVVIYDAKGNTLYSGLLHPR
ncbi:hypothetical protein JOF56_010531 [Kibdelosporangium banguiense]|uniref:Uncharacterized protein n=1 Tax=Kibdelosporangium banguiense TaxID=1365924 RepID=A0ABS4U1R0_9PSEU|nr:hypothetical protein [Kibdelosporangium banguiense]MBP2330146.1 hypothetical protein [Kibdelosporangium banguiense]